MPVDNTKIIKSQLRFSSPDMFYLVELISRRKDIPGLEKAQKYHGAYYLTSAAEEHLDGIFAEIKERCDALKCRAYVNLNPKSMRRWATQMIRQLAEGLDNGQFRNPYALCDSAAAKSTTPSEERTFLFDVDDPDPEVSRQVCDRLMAYYAQLKPKSSPAETRLPSEPVRCVTKTPNGWHIITYPVPLRPEFTESLPDCVEIKHNSPTVLYASCI